MAAVTGVRETKMKVIMEGKEVSVKDLSLTQWRQFMAEFMQKNPNASAAWNIMGCIRGPDFPSERPDMNSREREKAYSGRRKRKYETVEVLREAMFFGVVGGCARHHKEDHVLVMQDSNADHFDRHVVLAARALGIEVKHKDE